MMRPGPRASAASAHVPRRSLGQHFLIDKNIVHKVARLAAARGGKDYGALSIAAQFYCEVRQAFRVPPTCFRPKPQVGSAVVVLTPLRKPRVSVADEAFFFRIVRAGFAHRRKALPNSLRDEGFEGGPTAAALEQAGIDPRRRAETLSIEEFAALADGLLSLNKKE